MGMGDHLRASRSAEAQYMSGWTSLLTAGDLEELREALRRGWVTSLEWEAPALCGWRVSTQRAASVWSVPMLVRLEMDPRPVHTAPSYLTVWRRCWMDIDLRRLGMGAQLQIALALVGRGAERRDNHGRRGADCPVHRGAAAWPDLWATGGADNRGGAPEDRGQVPARPQKEGK